MLTTLNDISIDWLKDNNIRLYYFGLGFIQLKIDETYRLHFYSPELPSITEDIHNHRYDFVSTVLRGEITNHIYDVIVPGISHVMRNESCNEHVNAPSDEIECSLEHLITETIKEGESYQMLEHMFHRVEAKSCITLLERGPYTKEFAQIITPKGTMSVCPFSKKIDDNRLWEIIREMLR